MRELNWAGRLFLFIALMRWIFYPTTNAMLVAATKVIFVVALVFMYADWWAIVSWLWLQAKRLNTFINSETFQKPYRWFLAISLLPLAVYLLMKSALSSDPDLLAVTGCLGGVLLTFWVVLIVNFKKM